MKTTKKRSVWAWLGALAAGCGICCLPLIVPLLGGTALAGGLSWAALEGFPWDMIVCGLALGGAGGGAFWLLTRKKASPKDTCQTEVPPNQSRMSIEPLEKSNH